MRAHTGHKNPSIGNKILIGKCGICGDPFEKNSWNQKYCSTECLKKNDNKRKKAKYDSNPEWRAREIARKREYEVKIGMAKARENYKNDVGGARTKRIMRSKVRTIKRLIRAEVLGIPVYGQKQIWDGKGEWSRDYEWCVECGSTVYIYKSSGLCAKCYDMLKWQALNSNQKYKKKIYKRENSDEYLKSKATKDTEADKILEQVNKGEVETTDKIRNLLINLQDDSYKDGNTSQQNLAQVMLDEMRDPDHEED